MKKIVVCICGLNYEYIHYSVRDTDSVFLCKVLYGEYEWSVGPTMIVNEKPCYYLRLASGHS